MSNRGCLLATALFCLWASPATAQARDTGWRFKSAPYLMLPSLNGDIVVRGRTAKADIGPADIFSNLNLGYLGYVEATKDDKWGVGLDINYSNIDATDDDKFAEIDSTQGMYTLVLFRRIASGAELYGGARLNKIGENVDFQGPLGIESVRKNKRWIDPLVGVRLAAPLGDRWKFTIAADVGGFGIGSDIAVNVWPVVTYQFSSRISGTVGYRLIYTNYDAGSGVNRFGYDILMAGPTIGLVFNY